MRDNSLVTATNWQQLCLARLEPCRHFVWLRIFPPGDTFGHGVRPDGRLCCQRRLPWNAVGALFLSICTFAGAAWRHARDLWHAYPPVQFLLSGFGSILFARATGIELAYLGRFLIGFGASVRFLGSLALASKWFPPHRFAFLAGLAMVAGMTSGMLAQAPLAFLVDLYGWRANIMALGITGFILSFLLVLFVRNQPANMVPPRVEPVTSRQKLRELGSALKSVLRNADVWRISLVAATMSGPMLVIGGLWGAPYLMVKFELSRPEAAFFMSLLLLGWAAGAPFSGWLSDHLGRRKPILVAGLIIICLMLAAVTGISNLPLGAVVACLVVMGCRVVE